VIVAFSLCAVGCLALVCTGLIGYSLSLEYGFLAGSAAFLAVVAAAIGVVAGAVLVIAVRLLRHALRSRSAASGVVVGSAVVVAVAAMLGGGAIGYHRHQDEERRAAHACTAPRIAAFVEMKLPYTVGSPQGQHDGTCQDVFMVPGTPAQVDARIDATLLKLGWVPAKTGPDRVYRRGDMELRVMDAQPVSGTSTADPGWVPVPMNVR
jgi:hypothetical protein